MQKSLLRAVPTVVALVIVFSGCASKSSKTNGGGSAQPTGPQFGQQTGGNATTIPGVPNQVGASLNCIGQPIGPASAAGLSKPIDGNALFIYVNEQPVKLCDVLRMNNKAVAIFQFAGVDCLSCQDEAKATQAGLLASGSAASVMHVLAFTHKRGDFTAQDGQDFARKNAPSAVTGNDYEQKMWNFVNPMKRPATLIMNINMQAIAVTSEAEIPSIAAKAASLLPRQ